MSYIGRDFAVKTIDNGELRRAKLRGYARNAVPLIVGAALAAGGVVESFRYFDREAAYREGLKKARIGWVHGLSPNECISREITDYRDPVLGPGLQAMQRDAMTENMRRLNAETDNKLDDAMMPPGESFVAIDGNANGKLCD